MPRGFSDYDTAKLQGRLWTPAVLRPAAWLDASDLSTMTFDANGCTAIKDKTGIMSDFTQSTNAAKPQLTRNTKTGLSALSFDGGDRLVSTSGITSGSYSGELTFFSFLARANANGGDYFGERVGTPSGLNVVYIATWLFDSPDYYISGDFVNVSANTTIASSVYNLLDANGGIISQNHVSGSRDRLWVNGASQSVSTGTGSTITGAAGAVLGDRGPSGGIPWTGTIGEVIAITNTLDSYTRSLVEGYLGWKWGIPLAAEHPFANRPPLIGD